MLIVLFETGDAIIEGKGRVCAETEKQGK